MFDFILQMFGQNVWLTLFFFILLYETFSEIGI